MNARRVLRFGNLACRCLRNASTEQPERPNLRLTPKMVLSEATTSPQYYHVDEGKSFRTTVKSLQDEDTDRNYLCIYSYNQYGFRLTDRTFVIGPIALISHSALSWKVATVDEITEDSLILLTMITPRPDLVILGAGDKGNVPILEKRLRGFFNKHGLRAEIMSTPDACPMINYMNEEQRSAVALLFPVSELPKRDFSYLDSNMERALSREMDEDLLASTLGMRAKSLTEGIQQLLDERRQEIEEDKELTKRVKKD